jgi:Flp pilus assembly protein TadG
MENITNPASSLFSQCCNIGRLGEPEKVRADSGQAIIEMMILLPIFLVLMIGTVEFGRLAYAYIEVADAARAGVQYGAQNRATASDTAGMQQAALNDAPDVHGISLTPAPTHFCACSNAQSTTVSCTAVPACSGNNRLIEWVQVNTSVQVDPIFRFPGLPPAGKNFVLKGQAIMRVAQ